VKVTGQFPDLDSSHPPVIIFSASNTPPLFVITCSFIISVLSFVYNKNKINIHTFPSYVQGFHRILLQKSINPFLIASL
jgi:hypothetical protein